jgi:hypothetical protein
VDPSGYIAPGMKVRIPFRVNEADIDCTPLLMTDYNVVDFALEAPDGTVITPAGAPALGVSFEIGTQTRHFRFNLPVAIGTGQHAGLWHAILEVSGPDFKKLVAQLRERKDVNFQRVATHGARYSFVAQSRSNLKMVASLEQSGYEPGADLALRAVLTEYDLPVAKRASVRVELTRPGGSTVSLATAEVELGVFEVTTKAMTAGIYQARFLAQGVTLRGAPFTREHLATAAVWRGGDKPYQPPGDADGDRWCRLLLCLLSEKTLTPRLLERLKKEGVDIDALRKCVQVTCRPRLPRLTKSTDEGN